METQENEDILNNLPHRPPKKEGMKIAYELHEKGYSYSQIAKMLGVAKPTVAHWVREQRLIAEKEKKEEETLPPVIQPEKPKLEQVSIDTVVKDLNEGVTIVRTKPETPDKEQKEEKKPMYKNPIVLAVVLGVVAVVGIVIVYLLKSRKPKHEENMMEFIPQQQAETKKLDPLVRQYQQRVGRKYRLVVG